MALWPLRVYPRKRAGRRLNLTPTPDLGPSATAEVAPPRPGPRPLTAPRGLRLGPRDAQGFAGPQGKGKGRGLPQIAEKAEWGGPGSRGAEEPSTQLRDSGEKSLPASNTCEETQNEIAPLSESVTDDLQVDSSSSNSELVSGPGLQSDTSISFLSYSATESSTDYNSIEENLSSFSSPELFRGSNYLDWECPELTEYVQCKNSTLLDTSKAVAIEKAPEFSSLSAILDNADCEVLHPEKNPPSASEEAKKKLERDLEDGDKNIQRKLNHHAHIDTELSRPRPALESGTPSSVTRVLLPEPLAPALKTNSKKKNGGLLTSTPSSEAAGFVISLSSVRRASCEELLPNVSSYINSDEIVPVTSLPENSSNEFPSNRPEICCIISASPGTRQMKSKGVTIKKRESSPQDIPKDIIIKTNGRI